MLETLSTTLGLPAFAPAFWMPLVCGALLAALLVIVVVFDGVDLGVACLCLCVPAPLRTRMLARLLPWRDANTYVLLLGFGLFLTAFPHAVRVLLDTLTLPLTLLALGTLLRSTTCAFALRTPLVQRTPWQLGFSLGAWMVATAHGLLLAAFIMQFDTTDASYWFSALLVLGVIAAYGLSGATWLLLHETGELRHHAVRWARHALPWAVAAAVGLCAVLGLSNPTVLLRWASSLPWQGIALLWLGILAGVVALACSLQRTRVNQVSTLPFVLTLLMFLTLVGGLLYSVFPYFVLDEITLWNSAASITSLRPVMYALLVIVPILLVFNLRVYCGMLRVTPLQA